MAARVHWSQAICTCEGLFASVAWASGLMCTVQPHASQVRSTEPGIGVWPQTINVGVISLPPHHIGEYDDR